MENTSFMDRYLTPIAVLLGAVILALAYVYGGGVRENTGTGQEPSATVDINDVKTENAPYVGDVNAPVTMAIWFDYQCPFCKLFDEDAIAQVYTDYVLTGKVKVVFKDFQFLGEDSNTAAAFGRAMWELYPDKYYAWYQAMYGAQDDEGDRGFGDLTSIQTLTKTLEGIDVDKVTALMNAKKAEFMAAVQADRTEGASLGVNGTPAVIIGTQLFAGAQPYEVIKAAIDAELQ